MLLNRHVLCEIAPATLYALLRLRVDVFVVEQECPYPELDGRDLEPTAEHLWLTDEGPDEGPNVVATLRVLRDPDGITRIGRVATKADRRGEGLAATLIRAAMNGVTGPIVLDAQSHLAGWYSGFGFVQDGPEFIEDGIPHVPMRYSCL